MSGPSNAEIFLRRIDELTEQLAQAVERAEKAEARVKELETLLDVFCGLQIPELRAEVERLRELADQALACLQYPDNGRHYCRWCSAGTHNDWQHEEHCGYAAQCRKIEGVRTKAEALAAKEASDE